MMTQELFIQKNAANQPIVCHLLEGTLCPVNPKLQECFLSLFNYTDEQYDSMLEIESIYLNLKEKNQL